MQLGQARAGTAARTLGWDYWHSTGWPSVAGTIANTDQGPAKVVGR